MYAQIATCWSSSETDERLFILVALPKKKKFSRNIQSQGMLWFNGLVKSLIYQRNKKIIINWNTATFNALP